ncbi:hypothetical protein G6F44_002587 [Rhizopus delemar]|nr:hypothetical protein G6F44_002587 [Rhizopus delemar]
MHGESASVDITSENIQSELRKIEEILGTYDSVDIMNFDETGLYYQQTPRRTISPESLGDLKKFSHSYFVYTGIIDKFKAHFRAQQYDCALCLYISKKLDNPNAYEMDQAQAMVFLANEWLKVKPETINGMLPDLPRNFDNKVTDVSQLNLEADENEMIVCYTTSTTNNEEMAEGKIKETEKNDNTEKDEQHVDIVECKKRSRKAYEIILMYEAPLDDLDRKLHRRIRMRLAGLNKSKEQTDPKYKEAITSAVAEISAANVIMSINTISQQLTPVIVNCYDDSSFFIYKAKKSKVNWENIFCLIQDKNLGLYNENNIPNLYGSSSSRSVISRSINEESPGSSSESCSTMMKQALLESEDKIAILELYKNLGSLKMWKLSSGAIVEKKMEQFALACTFEHPCHSLILDGGDQCWEAVFTKEDLKEIKTFKLKPLPVLPKDLKDYFNSILSMSSSSQNDLDSLFKKVKSADFHPQKDSILEWAQSTVLNTIKLFMSNYFPLNDQSKADILRRIWLFLAPRKLMGRSVDMVYKLQPNEYGCMEYGRFESNSPKELSDRMFKIPIVMKDMFNSIAKIAPSLVNEFIISSLMIMETKISLIIMDSPMGHVCHISRLKPQYFPVCSVDFMNLLVSVMKLVYTARLSMENTFSLVAKTKCTLEYDLGDDVPVSPTFRKNLKRKRDIAEEDVDKNATEEDDTNKA